MADISAAEVKRLRDATGAGMMDCKRALQDAGGDIEKATLLLRERGLAGAAKRRGREAKDGLIHSYLHTPTPGRPARVGVLVEVSTETDFVANTDEVKDLARELALHIASEKPVYLQADDVPEHVLETERELMRKKLEGKPEQAIQKAVEQVVKSYAQQFCLLDQKWIRDEKQTVRQLVDSVAGKLGENVGVRRFVRYEVAEALD